jgi:hypothetical protein
MHSDSFSFIREDIANEYWRTYYEWCNAYGLLDNCMDELRAATLVESERASLTHTQRERLRKLAQLIETERQLLLDKAA